MDTDDVVTEPQLPSNASSPNFSRIFGTNTSAFELLVLKREIMGPCWLQIKHPEIDNKGVCTSHSLTHVNHHSFGSVRGRYHGVRSRQQSPTPKTSTRSPKPILTPPERCRPSLWSRLVYALSSTTEKTYARWSVLLHGFGQIVSGVIDNPRHLLMLRVVDIDDPTPPEALPCTVRTFVRPLDKFPPNFEARASKNGKGVISPMANERMLLNNLLGPWRFPSMQDVHSVGDYSYNPQGRPRRHRRA